MRAHTMCAIMSILKFVGKQSRASLSKVRLCVPWDRFVGAGLAACHGISYPSARPARGGRQHSFYLKKQLPLELPSLLARSEGSTVGACARSSARHVCVLTTPPCLLASAAPPQRAVGHARASGALINNYQALGQVGNSFDAYAVQLPACGNCAVAL